jgi:hypothetical protein
VRLQAAAWRDITNHLDLTVDIDNRLRVFYAGPLPGQEAPFVEAAKFAGHGPLDIGLVVECQRGELQLEQGDVRVAGALEVARVLSSA